MPPKKKKSMIGCCSSYNIKVVPGVCLFCNDAEDNEEKYGKMMSKNGLSVHYFCMLFSSALKQLGKTDDDGFLGFLPTDIKKEARRGKRLRCSFCKLAGATIGCVNTSCRQKYHYRCGLENDVLFQFYGSFSSFCPEHRPHQAPPTRERLGFKGCAKSTCAICLNSVTTRASNHTLRSPCCKHAWFHRACIQSMANSSGLHFFKCPLCNNKELFQQEMLIFGIYVPDQDAAWELEPNAFQDLMHIVSSCDVGNCICPFGRDVNHLDSEWEIMRCDVCGSKGTHLQCSNLTNALSDWACDDCTSVVDKKSLKQKGSPIPKDYLEAKMKNAGTSKTKGSTVKAKKTKAKKLFIPCKKKGSDKAKPKKASAGVKLKKFLETSPQIAHDSEVQLNVSPDSLAYLKHSLLNTGKKASNSIKKKYNTKKNKKKSSRYSLDVSSLIKKGEGCDMRSKKLKKSQSLVNVELDKEQPGSKRRATRRSQVADKALLELCPEDIEKRPIWIQKLYKEDLMTGKNLGDRFVKESPMLTIGSIQLQEEESEQEEEVTDKVSLPVKRSMEEKTRVCDMALKREKETKVQDQKEGGHNNNGKDLKQLLLTNFLNGGKASGQTLSPDTQVKKTNKLRLIKKRKRSSEESVKSADIHQFLCKTDKMSFNSKMSPSETSSLNTPPQKEMSEDQEQKIWGTPERKVKRRKLSDAKVSLKKKKASSVCPGKKKISKQNTPQKVKDETSENQDPKIWGTPERIAKPAKQAVAKTSLTGPLQEICSNNDGKKATLAPSNNQNVSTKFFTDTTFSKDNVKNEDATEVGTISDSSISVKTGSSSRRASSKRPKKLNGITPDVNDNVSPAAKKPRRNQQNNKKGKKTVLKKTCSNNIDCGASVDNLGVPMGWGRSLENSFNLTESSRSGNSVKKTRRKRKASHSLSSSSTIVLNSDSEIDAIPSLSHQNNNICMNLVSESDNEPIPSLPPKDNDICMNLVSESDNEPMPSLSPQNLKASADDSIKIPLIIDLVPELGDSETMSCEEDDVLQKNTKFPSFNEFIKSRDYKNMYLDLSSDITTDKDTSLICIDDSDIEDVSRQSCDKDTSVIDLSSSLISEKSKDINSNTETLSLQCTKDYSGFILTPPTTCGSGCSDSNSSGGLLQQTGSQSNMNRNRSKATMPQTDLYVENSSSFVDLGRYQGSQVCVIS